MTATVAKFNPAEQRVPPRPAPALTEIAEAVVLLALEAALAATT